ncbi:MAG: cytochrome C [Gammaproteobacteria bacterium]|nr:cytochrome C [Gammaproteobacteria bacterium]
MGLARYYGILALMFTLFTWHGQAMAGPMDRFERMVMPGKLSTGHVKYEKDCNNCHKPFEKGAQSDLCLDCHKKVNKDVVDKKGFHGRVPNIDTRKCSDCHKEHRGRDADIVAFDRDTFDHDRSDFKLKGSHTRLGCVNCHDPKTKYRDAGQGCVDCHKTDDAHEKRLGEKCGNCHIETVWGEAHYDHDKTKFKLEANHKHVACIDCHPNQRYEETPKGCYTCHQLRDVHEGNNGKKCESCHNAYFWNEIKFDHNKDTKYELEGRHVTVDCQSCHRGDVYKKIGKECIKCHKKEDAHRGLFGEKCHDCHISRSWSRATFNHNKDTKFELIGAHRKVDCVACHRADVYADLKKDCYACHRKNDVHEGQEGKDCKHCHNEKGWTSEVFFDHDLTRFPLLDSHAVTACEECHLTPAFKDTDTQCFSCHKKDDEKIHKLRLGENCSLCHNSNDWKKWFFDHDKQTDYKLTGGHKGLDCHACHTKPVKKEIKLSDKCVDCHEQDDYHHGAFGRECARCHITESFKKVIMN